MKKAVKYKKDSHTYHSWKPWNTFHKRLREKVTENRIETFETTETSYFSQNTPRIREEPKRLVVQKILVKITS